MTPPMTRAEILAWPPTIDLVTLGKALDRSEPTIRAAAHSGELEALGIKVVRLGAKYLVVTASVWVFLGISPDGEAAGATSEANPRVAPRPRRPAASALRSMTGNEEGRNGSQATRDLTQSPPPGAKS
jgi:hypothetical protein